MAKKQAEQPGTRRDDEPEPQKPIKELEDVIAAIRKDKGARTRANQRIVAAQTTAQEMLVKHGITRYLYDDERGIERALEINQKLKDVKVKVAKRGDAAEDDDDGGGE